VFDTVVGVGKDILMCQAHLLTAQLGLLSFGIGFAVMVLVATAMLVNRQKNGS
jgi:hypothetical protein